MKTVWTATQVAATAFGGWIVWLLGGCDGLLYALAALVAIDYITGVLCAISERKLSSEIGMRGIIKKVSVFLLVGVAHIVDGVIGSSGVLRSATLMFFISNEGISLLENVARIGVPIPPKLKDVLAQLRQRDEDGCDAK
ncbi:MAG: phage holin family protein [Oscillospiraceae bacterium]|nr:phage holin family protein [Oscillospiraceae bacterium]